jgi:predicted RecA/RadA family phage recombinase
MTTSNTTGYISLPTVAAIAEGQRVKINASGQIDVAAAGDVAVGVATMAAASGAHCTVKLWTAPGTFICRANAAIAAGARLYPTASGNVDDAVGTTPLNLVALTAATAANDLIECLPCMVGA